MNVKTILTIIGAIAVGVIGVLFGRSTKRGRVHRTHDDIREIGESVGRTEDSIDEARRTVGNSRRLVGESLDGNKEAKGLLGRAKEILGGAKSRGDNLDGDNRVG